LFIYLIHCTGGLVDHHRLILLFIISPPPNRRWTQMLAKVSSSCLL